MSYPESHEDAAMGLLRRTMLTRTTDVPRTSGCDRCEAQVVGAKGQDQAGTSRVAIPRVGLSQSWYG